MSRIFVIAVLISLVAVTASAQENNKKPELSSEQPASSTIEKSAIQENVLAPNSARNLELRAEMNEEIATRLATEETTIAKLASDLDRSVTSEDRQATQRRISLAKQTAWRDILAIQLKYAQLGGYTDQATELAMRIARLDEGLSKSQAMQQSSRRDDVQIDRGGE